ncbi:YbaY family lipoprotein [Hymenobacter koreensis]|uniref:Lipoprotein n=1 Tax=Hymenobacter koreensis TaxID=1084523 RepID=A0ABP8J4G2_9BACT
MKTNLLSLLSVLLLSCSSSSQPPVTEAPTAASSQSAMAEVAGTLTYRERIALPDDAVIEVELVDMSGGDAQVRVLAQQRWQAAGKQVPFAYRIAYHPDSIQQNRRYGVQARIRYGEPAATQLLFVTDKAYPVLTQSQPSAADLVLVRAQK